MTIAIPNRNRTVICKFSSMSSSAFPTAQGFFPHTAWRGRSARQTSPQCMTGQVHWQDQDQIKCLKPQTFANYQDCSGRMGRILKHHSTGWLWLGTSKRPLNKVEFMIILASSRRFPSSKPNGSSNQMHSSGHVQQSPASAIDDLAPKEYIVDSLQRWHVTRPIQP